MGVLTGTTRLDLSGILSELNNLKTNSILHKGYDKHFGLLQVEVENALHDFNLDCHIDKVQDYYNGYKFGTLQIYNTWSILNYIKNGDLKPYWSHSSYDGLIKDLLLVSDAIVFEQLDNLLKDKGKTVYVNDSIDLGNHLQTNYLWQLMLFSGYLTVKDKINYEAYLVKIPNKEIKSLIQNLVADIVLNKGYNNSTSIKEA